MAGTLNCMTPACPSPDPSQAEQAALLGRLRQGEDAAFRDLMDMAGGRMLAVARRMLPTDDDAREAVQDALLSAFRNLHRFDGRALLTTWLHRITVNACLMKLRTRRRRPESSIEDLLPTFLPDGHQTRPAEPWAPDRLERAETSEATARLVREKIGELPETYREILLLRDIEDLSTEEAAQALGISSNAVKTKLHRARQALRALLDPHMRADGGEAC